MLRPGTRIGGLLIHEMVGRGAMGEVYRAEQVNLHRPVAVKRIASHLVDQPGIIARFEREARLVATLNSPHVVQVYEFGPYEDVEGDKHLLLVMEWVEGGRSLRQCMKPNIGLAWPSVARILQQAALGLHIAHEQGIVHRDIKPDNMLLSPKGDVKIADFGLAYASDSSALTADGSVIGTPNYLSPEACSGEDIGPAGDMYSLGASCFHLLTGCPVYTATTTIALLRAHCDQAVPNISNYLPNLPDQFATLITGMLQKSVKDRVNSGKTVLDALAKMEQQGLAFSQTLSHLVTIADENHEPSSLPTAVDVNAETNISANVAKTLGSRSNTASTTAETLIAADVLRDPTDAITKLQSSPASKPVPATINPAAHKRIGTLLPILLGLLCVAAIALFVLLQVDPIKKACDDIHNHVLSGETDIALSIAYKLLAEEPGNKDIHNSFNSIISAEIATLIKNERFEEALKRLDEHRLRNTWLNIDHWQIDVLLANAILIYKNDSFASEEILRNLRKQFPKEVRISQVYLEYFGFGKQDRHSNGAVAAAIDLLEAGEAATEHLGDTLYAGYLYARIDGEWTNKIRNLLLTHYRKMTIEKSKERLTDESDSYRIHAYNVLKATQSLDAAAELAHHLRNYFNMTSYGDEWKLSHAWLEEQSKAATWSTLKQEVDIASFSAAQVLNSWSDKQELSAGLIAHAFLPEMKTSLLLMVNDPEQENVRFNAYEILMKAGYQAEINTWDFHATTLTTFSASYHIPRDFKAALDYFTNELKGEKASAARAALEASKKYILEYIEIITKNGFENRTPNCRTNIKAIGAILDPSSVQE